MSAAPQPAGREPEADPQRYARVVVDVDPAHLDRHFDYRVPDGVDVTVGCRVRVAFHGRRRQGWVVATTDAPAFDPDRVRDLAPWGEHPLFDEADLRLYRWIATRYAAPLAHVLRHAIPKRVAAVDADVARWGPAPPPAACPAGPAGGSWSTAWQDYDAGDLLHAISTLPPPDRDGTVATPIAVPPAFWWRTLPRAHRSRSEGDRSGVESPGGSGPPADDLALELVRATLARGRGVVIVAPDPRSPLIEAVLDAFTDVAVDHRSARSDRTRFRAFLRGATGHARVAVGERAAVFAPVPAPGLILVDDEANAAFKERRSPRHHAREVALTRARFAGAVCVLRGDLPSAALWRLLAGGHVGRVEPVRSVERADRPRVDVVDLGSPRPGIRRARLSSLANRALADVVVAGGRAVVLAARGGVGAALACTSCGRRRECPVCAGSLRPRRLDVSTDGRPTRISPTWECPGCGWTGRPMPCSTCGAERTAPLAAGAGRLAEELQRSHPAAQVVRMEGFDAPGPDRAPAIAVMTRGSVVDDPSWLRGEAASLAVAPDADGMLSRPSIEAAEDTVRLWFATARLAGRMIVQTREPGHHAVQALVRWDPDGFWTAEAPRRARFGFPPARSLVAVTCPPAEATVAGEELRAVLPPGDELLGPSPEGAWIVKADDLHSTNAAIYELRRAWDRDGRAIRVDVDPVGLV